MMLLDSLPNNNGFEFDCLYSISCFCVRTISTSPTKATIHKFYSCTIKDHFSIIRYCLMSVAGCYTDFHLDFGGTSVWYHVLKGEKIFFLIPPSSTTYLRFEEWQKHGQQEKTFFPDLVENCTLVHLKEGDTLLLPSGNNNNNNNNNRHL